MSFTEDPQRQNTITAPLPNVQAPRSVPRGGFCRNRRGRSGTASLPLPAPRSLGPVPKPGRPGGPRPRPPGPHLPRPTPRPPHRAAPSPAGCGRCAPRSGTWPSACAGPAAPGLPRRAPAPSRPLPAERRKRGGARPSRPAPSLALAAAEPCGTGAGAREGWAAAGLGRAEGPVPGGGARADERCRAGSGHRAAG